jgi:hypothetical protein
LSVREPSGVTRTSVRPLNKEIQPRRANCKPPPAPEHPSRRQRKTRHRGLSLAADVGFAPNRIGVGRRQCRARLPIAMGVSLRRCGNRPASLHLVPFALDRPPGHREQHDRRAAIDPMRGYVADTLTSSRSRARRRGGTGGSAARRKVRKRARRTGGGTYSCIVRTGAIHAGTVRAWTGGAGAVQTCSIGAFADRRRPGGKALCTIILCQSPTHGGCAHQHYECEQPNRFHR